MTRDEIIKLAHETECLDEGHYGSLWMYRLERFAALVAAAEREQCALAAWEVVQYEVHVDLADKVAQAIRARGQQ